MAILNRTTDTAGYFYYEFCLTHPGLSKASGRTGVERLVLLFTSLFAIPFTCERFLDALLFAWLQVEGVTLDFLDDVLLLYLPLKAAQRIL